MLKEVEEPSKEITDMTIETEIEVATEMTEGEIDLTVDLEEIITIPQEGATTAEKMVTLLGNALNVYLFNQSARKPR